MRKTQVRQNISSPEDQELWEVEQIPQERDEDDRRNTASDIAAENEVNE